MLPREAATIDRIMDICICEYIYKSILQSELRQAVGNPWTILNVNFHNCHYRAVDVTLMPAAADASPSLTPRRRMSNCLEL